MGILSRGEQSVFVRNFSALLLSGRSVRDALYQLAEDLKESGIFPFELPRFLKKFQKGYAGRVVEETAYEIDQGVKIADAIMRLEVLDEDVRQSLAKAIEGEAEEMVFTLADTLEKEAELGANIRNILIVPALVLVVLVALSYVVCFKLATAVKEMITSTKVASLPLGPRLAIYLSDHPSVYFVLVSSFVGGVVAFVRSSLWRKLIPAYRNFERFRFLSWLKVLTSAGFSVYSAFLFLSGASFSKKLKDALEDVVSDIESGISIESAVERLKGFLKPSEVSFIKTGVKTGDVSKELEPLVRVVEKEAERSIKKSSTVINIITLLITGVIVAIIYIGIIIPFVMGIRRAI
jgi:type II secretory pathway component PulF